MNQFDFVQDAVDSSNPILVMKNGLWGLIDTHENILIEPKYDCIERFINGFAIVKKNGLHGFVNNKGVEIVSLKYTQAEPFTFIKYAFVACGRRYGIIDENGKEHLFNNCSNIKSANSHILFICDKRGTWHTFNTRNNKLYYLYIKDFYELDEHYVIINSEGLLGLLDPNGNIIIECKYRSIDKIHKWMYVVYDNTDDCFIYNLLTRSFNYVGAIHVNSVVELNGDFYLTYTDADGKIRFIETVNYMPLMNKYCDKIIENNLNTLKVEIDGKIGYFYL